MFHVERPGAPSADPHSPIRALPWTDGRYPRKNLPLLAGVIIGP